VTIFQPVPGNVPAATKRSLTSRLDKYCGLLHPTI